MKRLCDYLPASCLKGIGSRESDFVPTGQIWPTGEWSLGYRRIRPDDDQRFGHLADTPGGFGDDRWGEGAAALSPLNLSNVRNPHTASARPETYGRKGITGYGKKMVRSFGAVVDRDYPSHRVTFATLTVPKMEQCDRSRLAAAWPELVRQCLQWLQRCLRQAGMPRLVVSVTEIQPGRLRAGNGGYLHLHLLWLNAPGKKGGWSVDVLAMRAWAERFFQRRGLMPDGGWVNVNVKAVKSGAAAYLSKYASKGGGLIAEFAADCGWAAVPGQWWSLTAAARSLVKESVLKGDSVGAVLDAVVQLFWDSPIEGLFRYLYSVELDVGGGLVNVGWRGCLTRWGLKEVTHSL